MNQGFSSSKEDDKEKKEEEEKKKRRSNNALQDFWTLNFEKVPCSIFVVHPSVLPGVIGEATLSIRGEYLGVLPFYFDFVF